MNYINATTLRKNLAGTIKAVRTSKKPLLVSNRGKIVAGLLDIDLLEDLLELKDKKYVKSIRKSREEFEKGDTFAMEEVFGNL